MKKKDAWEANSWSELAELLGGEDQALERITSLLEQKERQRIGDKRRNETRRAILAWAKDHKDELPEELQ